MCVLYNDIGFVKLFYLFLLYGVFLSLFWSIRKTTLIIMVFHYLTILIKLTGGWDPLTSFRQLHFCCACSMPGHGFQ